MAAKNLSALAVAFRIGGSVGLRQQDDRFRPRLGGQRKIAFQPRRVEVGIAGGDDEQRIDIGCNQLQFVSGTCGTAAKLCLAVKTSDDPGAVRENPVTDGKLTRRLRTGEWQGDGTRGR
jgi:hypothetical protein